MSRAVDSAPPFLGAEAPARNVQLVVAMILISVSVFATLAWTVALAWSVGSLVRGLTTAIAHS